MCIRARGPRGDRPSMEHEAKDANGTVSGEGGPTVSVLSRPFARGLLALVVLGATVVAIHMVQVSERDRAAAESAALSTARAKQLRELVSGHLATLELRAQNAGTNPRLVAALGGNVSRETLRDLFQHRVLVAAVPRIVRQHLPGGARRPDHLHRRQRRDEPAGRRAGGAGARQPLGGQRPGGRGRAGARGGGGARGDAQPGAHAGAAADPALRVAGAGRRSPSAPARRWCCRDGKSALVGAGPSAQTALLRQSDRPATGTAPQRRCPTAPAVATSEVAPGLWLLGHVDTDTAVTRATALFTVLRVGVGVDRRGAVPAAALVGPPARRGPEREPVAAPIPATQTEVSERQPLRAAAAAGRRRHGRGAPGGGGGRARLPPPLRGQAPAPRADRQPPGGGPVHRRGHAGLVAGARQHRPHLRLRQGGRAVPAGRGVHRRPRPGQAGAQGARRWASGWARRWWPTSASRR